jgi:hypothetical protein
VTWEILMRVAARIERTHSAEALKLRLCASEVRWMEQMAKAVVADAIAEEQHVMESR